LRKCLANDKKMSQLFIAILPILGTLAGAGLTYLVTSRIEARKWRQQIEAENHRWEKEKADLRSQRKREALEIILGWIEPIRESAWQASSLIGKHQRGDIDGEEFRSKYPKLKESLQPLPAHYKAFLPQELDIKLKHLQMKLYLGIIATFDKSIATKSKERVDSIRDEITKLEEELQKEYLKTFN
jgi:polyhydroxyalkanoate synthesis regulator phasin